MRLQKYMAKCGVASRRKSEEYIKNGLVKVNGKIVLDPATDITDLDTVEFKGDVITINNKNVYYLLNKPINVLSSAKDDRGRVCVTDLIDTDKRIYPVGRLDFDTSGLIILTNDGEITHALTHPSKEIEKTYIAKINKHIDKQNIRKLETGIIIEGKKTAPATVNVLEKTRHEMVLEVKIIEGRNRQIRKMFEAVGAKVIGLKRISIGQITDNKLNPGQYRKLNKSELDYLEKIKNEKV